MEENLIKTEILTLEEVEKKGISFIIPTYQRPYTWGKEQAEKLFNDIEKSYKEAKEIEDEYYIGASLSSLREGNLYELVDGQQRITTLMLISLALKKVQKDKGLPENNLSKISLIEKNLRLSFEIREKSSHFMGYYAGIYSDLPDNKKVENIYLKNLKINLNKFENLLSNFIALHEEKASEEFFQYIFQKVKWVNNIPPKSTDLNRLFFTMNTSGIQLNQTDSLKAKLLKKILGKEEKIFYNKIWMASQNMENYFEKGLKKSLKQSIENFKSFESFILNANMPSEKENDFEGKSLKELINQDPNSFLEIENKEKSEIEAQKKEKEEEEEDQGYRSIISFELLLIHTLRIFSIEKEGCDPEGSFKKENLINYFNFFLEKDEKTIKDFFLYLAKVRFVFDKWVVKRIKELVGEKEKEILSLDGKKEISSLVQLESLLYFSTDKIYYWLTPFLGKLIKIPDIEEQGVLSILKGIDNTLSLLDQNIETQKSASFKISKGEIPDLQEWSQIEDYFNQKKGTGFKHYWFQKLEYVLWEEADESDEKVKKYRIHSLNSVEHIHPQNEENGKTLENDPSDNKSYLDSFGNLALLTVGQNSSYSNKPVDEKKASFNNKPDYQSLKLKDIFSYEKWGEDEIIKHKNKMIGALKKYYEI